MGQLTSVVEANQKFAESFDKGDLEIPPARNIAVLTCIDARIDPARSGEDVSEVDFLTFRDLDQSVRDDVDRIRSLGPIPADATVSGHVYDVRTGTLREVVPAV